jgi:KDO2-lipid IV(A) lauroyltransferase
MLVWLSRRVQRLPLETALRWARAVAWVWYYLLPLRRGVALANVRRVFPEAAPARQRQIVRRCMEGLCMHVVEGLRLPILTPELSRELVDGTGMQTHMDPLLARGKGVIAVTAHIGNFELIACSQTVLGYKVNAVVKDIHWKPAQAFWNQVREATRFGALPPRRSKELIREILGRNEIVAFAVDQHMAKHRAIVCEFFGQLASTTPAPVRFAMETGAAILPAFIVRTDDAGHHRMIFEPELVLETPYASTEANIRHNTERLNRILEGWIRAYPEQWLWLHKRWKVQDRPQGWDVPAPLRHLVGDAR